MTRAAAFVPTLSTQASQSWPRRLAGGTSDPSGKLPSGVVTFLLTDIEHSTELWNRHAAAMPSALRRHDQLVARSVTRHRGFLIKSKGEGDATLSVFQSASDALAAAVALRRAIQGEQWPDGLRLHLHVAIHTGEALERDGDYFGPAVNRAARLRGLAKGGQILASSVAAELVRERLPRGAALVDAGEHALRGFARGERVFLVTSADAAEGRAATQGTPPMLQLPDALGAGAAGPFVGRDAEISRLEALMSEVHSAALRCAFVAGEPGVGKTRLAAEFAAAQHVRGALVLYGRTDEETLYPYQPFVEALRRWAAALTPEQRAAVPQAEYLERLVPELARISTAVPQEDPEVERYRFFEAVATTLAHASTAGPMLLVLDDLHWADRSTLQLLRYLLRTQSRSPILVLGIYQEFELRRTRPLVETLADLGREHGFERIQLRGLAETQIVDLLQRTAKRDLNSTGLVLARQLLETTEGNPFFIEQIISNLLESGRLVADSESALVKGIDQLTIPEGVVEAIGRRLSRLTDPCNRALAAASVLGREFEVEILTDMLGGDADIVSVAIEEASRAGLLRDASGSGRATVYAFAHRLVQQAVYQELSLVRRQRWHVQAVASIEAIHATDLDAYIPELARHLRAAGAAAVPAKAVDYSTRALKAAKQGYAFEEAIAHGEAAVALTDLHGTHPLIRARILELLGDVTYIAGVDYKRSIHQLEQALAVYETLGDDRDRARVHSKLGRAFSSYWGFIDIPRALGHLYAAVRHFDSTVEPLVVGRLAISLATASGYAGHFGESETWSERASEIGRQTGDQAISSLGMSTAGWRLLNQGRLDDGLGLLEQAWQEADRCDHLPAAFAATWFAGGVPLTVDADAALRFLRRELDTPRQFQAVNMRQMLLMLAQQALVLRGDITGSRRLGHEMHSASDVYVNSALGRLRFYEGDWTAALANAQELTATRRSSGSRTSLAFAAIWLGTVLWTRGEVGPARQALEEGVACGTPLKRLQAHALLAVLEAEAQRVARARTHLHRCEQIIRAGNGWRGLLGLAARARGATAAAQGKRSEADAGFTASAEAFTRHGFPWEEAETMLVWGRALLRDGDRAAGTEKLDRALAVYQQHGAGSAWHERVLADRRAVE